MRRRGLLALAAVGAVASLALGTGLLAVFTDVARTGFGDEANRDNVATAERGKEADLVIAAGDWRLHRCGTYTDDLATPVISATGVEPGESVGPLSGSTDVLVCLRNDGEQPISTLDVTTMVVTDEEIACTGSEPEVDPDGATCGTTGEASDWMAWSMQNVSCSTTYYYEPTPPTVPLRGGSVSMSLESVDGVLDPGEQACYVPRVIYAPVERTDVVASQSDRAAFRFRFSAEVE